MARALRIKYKNALYHITSRGNERRNIFADDPNRDFFLIEEKELEMRFGKEYIEYKKQVPFLIPNFRKK